MASRSLIEAIAVTAELCGRTFTEVAARVFVDDLAGHPEQQVMAALKRCRREVRGILTLHEVLSRIDDGHRGADEAWALVMAGRDEADTVVWTEEIGHAWDIARHVFDTDDVGSRVAFRDAYNRLVAAARQAGRPADWRVIEGHDATRRAEAVKRAIAMGRVPHGAADYLTLPPVRGPVALLEGPIEDVPGVESEAKQDALVRIRAARAARLEPRGSPDAAAKLRTQQLRIETQAKVARYATLNGINLAAIDAAQHPAQTEGLDE